MTNKERVEEIAIIIYGRGNYAWGLASNADKEKCRGKAAQIDAVYGWIPMTEKPKKSGFYLVKYQSGSVDVITHYQVTRFFAEYRNGDGRWGNEGDWIKNIGWKPIEPPTEEGE